MRSECESEVCIPTCLHADLSQARYFPLMQVTPVFKVSLFVKLSVLPILVIAPPNSPFESKDDDSCTVNTP